MAFKKVAPPKDTPDTPDKLFLDLPRRKHPDVLPHQREVMRTYAAQAVDQPDVALQLPTGSGKTLVGLLIAEWRRRKSGDRLVYLCPTKQLVNQVVEQGDERYGITPLAFIGSKHEYSPASKAAYQTAQRVAVTTYSSLFNTSPFFSDADVVILDDAHAAENYVAALWSLRIERTRPGHESIHAAVCGVLKPKLPPTDFTRLSGEWDSPSDRAWVDKLPTPIFAELRNDICEVIDAHAPGTDLRFPWSMIREHLHACHIYLSPHEILIRPLIPPTWTHAAFTQPKQRIYMSATLGAGGDLERLMGRQAITRLGIPEGWDRQGVGRRFFIFPGMSLPDEELPQLRREFMRRTSRSLVLVPSDRVREEIANEVEESLGFEPFDAEDIEESKKPFVSTSPAAAVVANRYDGIDFSGDECRLLFVEGLPKATNAQERFLMARMGANILFNERIQIRVLQAIGRCTRSLEDYSAVVVSGEEMQDYLADRRRRRFLHPELQSELEFGVEQSTEVSLADMVDNFEIFLRNDEQWEEVNERIVAGRRAAVQEPFPAMDDLRAVVTSEVKYQERLWQGDFDSALERAEQVLGGLDAPTLRGYRALWHYLAGSAGWLGAQAGEAGLESKARLHFGRAKDAANQIPWLVNLARFRGGESVEEAPTVPMSQLERVERVLERLGTVHDRSFARREKEILDGLASKEKGPFERAHRLLGELLGFDAQNVEVEGSPDPWWLSDSLCFVFEDHAGAEATSSLDVSKARQASSHPAWMQDNVRAAHGSEIIAVLVTPVSKVRKAAVPHLREVCLWPLDEFRSWAQNGLTAVRSLRTTFVEPGDLDWRAKAVDVFEQNQLGAAQLRSRLMTRLAADQLEVTG